MNLNPGAQLVGYAAVVIGASYGSGSGTLIHCQQDDDNIHVSPGVRGEECDVRSM